MGSRCEVLLDKKEMSVAVRLVARYQKRYLSLRRFEFDDLLQECLTHWIFIRKKRVSDSWAHPSDPLIAQVLMNKLTDFVRAALSARRAGDLRTFSVDWLERNSDGIETPEEAPEWIRGGALEEPIARAELAIDLETACARLTPRQQSICQLIWRDGAGVTAVSRELHISRVTVHSELARIRTIFDSLGLSSYLGG